MAQCIRFDGFDGIWPLDQFESSQEQFDVDAGAYRASGRARISGVIGLLMRPCKAKGP